MTAEDRAPIGRRRAAIDVVVQLAGQLVNLALGLAVVVVLVRSLGETGFGQWSTVMAVMVIAGYVASMGLEPTAVKEAAEAPDREPEWLGALFALRLGAAVPVALASIALLLLLTGGGHDMHVAAILIAVSLPLGAPGALRAVFRLRVRNDVPVAVNTLNSVLWTAAVVVIAAEDGGLVEYAAAFLAVAVVTNALMAFLALRTAPIAVRASRPLWGRLIRLGVPVGIVNLLTIAYGKIDQVLVFGLAGEREAGLYGAAYRLLDAIQFLPIAVMTTLFPLIAAAHGKDPERVRRMIRMSAEYLSLVSLPVLAFTIVAPEQILELLFGEEFRDAAPALPVLMGAFVLICFGYLAGNLIIVFEMQRRMVAFAAIALVFNVALNLVLVPEYGFEAAAWITLATELLILALSLRLVAQGLGTRMPVGRVPRMVLAAALMGGVLVGLEEAGLGVVGLGLAGALAYTLAVFGLRAVSWEELRAFLQRPEPPA